MADKLKKITLDDLLEILNVLELTEDLLMGNWEKFDVKKIGRKLLFDRDKRHSLLKIILKDDNAHLLGLREAIGGIKDFLLQAMDLFEGLIELMKDITSTVKKFNKEIPEEGK